METQTTIGYGTFYPDTRCGGSIPLIFIQMTIGFLLETLLVGFILELSEFPLKTEVHRRKFLVLLCMDSMTDFQDYQNLHAYNSISTRKWQTGSKLRKMPGKK
jgi:hypothetical protein